MNEDYQEIIKMLENALIDKTKALDETRDRLIEVTKTMAELLEYIIQDKEITISTYRNIDSIIRKGYINLKDKI